MFQIEVRQAQKNPSHKTIFFIFLNFCKIKIIAFREEKLHEVLVRISIAMKKHHYHSSSYKGKHTIAVSPLQFRGSVHYHHGETWGNAGRHAGEVTESLTSCRQQEVV